MLENRLYFPTPYFNIKCNVFVKEYTPTFIKCQCLLHKTCNTIYTYNSQHTFYTAFCIVREDF